MYQLTLLLHSWLRWVVLLAAVVTLVRSAVALRRRATWTRSDGTWLRVFIGTLDLQILLGLLLYFVLSPFTPKNMEMLRSAMQASYLRFFAVEHVMSMVIAVVLAHVGAVRVRRAATDRLRQRAVLIFVGLALLAILIGIPWPFLPYARPLFRV